jgi:hypothetical protein
MNLREGGVYCLPNGRQLILLRKYDSENPTYTLRRSDGIDQIEYEVNQAGRLIRDGKLTAWDLADLRDTQVTASEYSSDL